MSSGLPSLLGNAQQPISFSGNPFNHFGYLFGQQTGQQASVNQSPNSTASTSSSTSSSSTSNRFKVKRHRQRVDAGEPRNTYQAKRAVDPMVQIENLWLQQTKKMQEEQEKKQVDEVDEEQTQSDDNEEKLFENIKQESTECEEDNQDAKSIKNEDDADYSINVTESTTISRESPSSTSSSSKRKSFQPQKINEHVDDEQQVEEKPDNINCAIQQQLNANPQLPANIFEAQKKLYAAFIEQQRKMITLKTELFDNLTASIEKIVKDWATSELNRQETAGTAAQPFFASPMAQFMPNTIGNGIFPPVPQIAFNQLQAFNALRRNLEEEGQPKRKRAKLSDAKERTSPMSAPASPPVNRYFPPTMVAHPMYKAFGDREVSPTNSEEMSDCGPHNAFDTAASYTLTPMHLRKAKLMFFYTRYPNSNLLKSYFPDIMFNKNNTAQLVKWFSNFREFYYIQMEKFARQLIAEGVKSRDEIFVTKESELFKALNTHYNRNNHIQAPDRLVFVVQETLREFFDAIRLGKDAEPSWKKTIYKIINRMDDPIPEYFKDPNFLDRLES